MESFKLIKSEVIVCLFTAGDTAAHYDDNLPSRFSAGFPVSAVKIAISSTDGDIVAGNDNLNSLYIDNLFAGAFFMDTSISGQNDPALHKFPNPLLFEGQKNIRLLEAATDTIRVFITLTYYGNP